MWKRKNKRTVLNIFLAILIILMVYVLIRVYKEVQAVQKAQDEELIAIANESNKVSEEMKEASYEDLHNQYREDLETIKKYMPGIVCWGDLTTQGTASGVSYPSTLQDLIDERIVKQYSFKSTVDNPYSYTRVDWDAFTIEIPVVNLGCGEETTYTVLGRAGADPYTLSQDATIPADSTPVNVMFKSASGNKTEPLLGGDGGVNPVTIAGIEGTLSCDDASSTWNRKYTFTRLVPGEETKVEDGEVISTFASAAYKDYIHVVFIGTYGTYDSTEDLVEQVRQLLNTQAGDSDRFIVIGPYYNSRYADYYSSIYANSFFSDLNTDMCLEFGDRYINLRKYLMEEALNDLGITMTAEERSKQKNSGSIPTALLSGTSEIELNGKTYELIGKLVYDRMEQLGYFDEIKEELGIPDWTGN